MDWNTYKGRRKTNLAEFLKDLKSEEEALAAFSDLRITEIPLEEVRSHYAKAVELPPLEEKAIESQVEKVPEQEATVTSSTKKTKVSLSGTSTN